MSERDINRVVAVVIQSINGNAYGTQFSALEPSANGQRNRCRPMVICAGHGTLMGVLLNLIVD